MDWASISRPGTLSVWLSLALGLLPSMAAFCQVAPPRTVSAALAGLRPLAFVVSSRARPEIFARRRVGMIHGEIVRPDGRPACGEKVGRPTSAFRTRGEWNDLGAHENPSHNAIAIRPAKASEIRYAVMPGSSLRGRRFRVWCQMRGMTAFAGHFRSDPYLSKGGRVPARSRASAKLKGSDGGARQGALRQALHGDWCAPRPPSDSGIGIRKSPRPVSRRGLNSQFLR